MGKQAPQPMMDRRNLMRWGVAAAAWKLPGWAGAAQAQTTAFLGRDGWAFYRVEYSEPALVPNAARCVRLLGAFSKLAEAAGIRVHVTLVPIKIRIFQQFLPEPLPARLQTAYGDLLTQLQQQGVNAIDLNTPFMARAQEAGAEPTFLKLDTHWSQSGALLAAQTIEKALKADPVSKGILEALPAAAYQMSPLPSKKRTRGRDLVGMLPAEEQKQPHELVQEFKFTPLPGGQLLGDDAYRLALVGSSYSQDWTQFADALRFVLQRHIRSVSTPADQGSWVGMLNYLGDDAFRKDRPKLLIWELPERDMIAPPDFPFREARYQMSEEAWLKKVQAALG